MQKSKHAVWQLPHTKRHLGPTRSVHAVTAGALTNSQAVYDVQYIIYIMFSYSAVSFVSRLECFKSLVGPEVISMDLFMK